MQLGEIQVLTVMRQVDFGVYLASPQSPEERVLLPKKQRSEEHTSELQSRLKI